MFRAGGCELANRAVRPRLATPVRAVSDRGPTGLAVPVVEQLYLGVLGNRRQADGGRGLGRNREVRVELRADRLEHVHGGFERVDAGSVAEKHRVPEVL